jgi:hypothetical protein
MRAQLKNNICGLSNVTITQKYIENVFRALPDMKRLYVVIHLVPTQNTMLLHNNAILCYKAV